jgi:hypothetical protein
MPFITRARNFLQNPDSIVTTPRKRQIMVDTVQFLFDKNAIGYGNAISTDLIVEYLQDLDHKIERGPWETDILGPLRDNGVWLGSKTGSDGGIFLIKNQADVDIVKETYGKKAVTMIRRYRILEDLEKEL